ncbi:MAG TPA: tetratricopeptide repeat protein [Flavobacteriales bacterium]|nr:tetratricopeptide repeat protein [Flavobacteriales bacterium]
MKRVVLILCLCYVFAPASAQIDSLKKVLTTKKITTKQRVETLKELSFQYCYVNPDSGIYFARKILAIAAKTGDPEIKARGQSVMGTNFYIKESLDSAKFYYKEVIAYAEKVKNLKLLSSNYNNIGLIYLDVSELKTAAYYLHKGLEARIKLDDKKLICESYDNIGLVYEKAGDYTQSLKFHLKALTIAEELKNNALMSYCYNNVAGSLAQSKNFEKSLEYYFKSLKCIRDTNEHYEMFLTATNIAITYSHLKASVKAWYYLKQALKHQAKLQGFTGLETSYHNMANILYQANDSLLHELNITRQQALDSAEHYVRLSIKIGETGFDYRQRTSALLTLVEMLVQKNKAAEARQHAFQALEFAQKGHARDMELKALYSVADVLKRLKQPDEAYDYLEKYIELRGIIFTESKNNEVISREMRYEFQKKQLADSVVHAQNIAKQKAIIKEKEFRMYLLYGGILVVLIFSFFLYNRIKVINKQKHTIQQQKILVEQKQKEVIDSIYYAKRIQQALLPSNKYIKKVMEKLSRKE